jgi:hypothetical protein
VLQRLARHTEEEARMATALVLREVHVKSVVNGTQRLHGCLIDVLNCSPVRRKDIKRYPTGSRYVSPLDLHFEVTQAGLRGLVTTSGEQLQKDIRAWLSPPDPSQNHIIARGQLHDGTAEWFVQGIFEGWRTTGSLLWIHGKRASLSDLHSYTC